MNAKKNSNFRVEFFLTRTKKSSINRFSLSDFVRKKKKYEFRRHFSERERENKKMGGKNSEKNNHFE